MDELEVRVHDEITGYKERFFGLTIRQWIAIAIVFAINVPVYMLGLHYEVNDQILKLVVVAFAVLPGMWGFIKIQNMNAEVYLRYLFRHYLLFGKEMSYQTDQEYVEEKAKTKKQKKAEQKELKKLQRKAKHIVKKSRAERKAEKRRLKIEKREEIAKKKATRVERKNARLLAKAYAKYGISEEEETPSKKVVAVSDDSDSVEITQEDLDLLKRLKMLEELQKEKDKEV